MKYIIDIKPEYEDSFKGVMILGAKDSNLFVDTLVVEDLEELNSDYINEHFGDLQDTAYQKGFEDGKEQGQNEAWDCAKRIILHPDNGGMTCAEISAAFGEASATNVLYICSAPEAIKKLKAHEEKQKAENKIKVKDEVVWTCDENVVIVVTSVYTVEGMGWCDGVTKNGKAYSILTKNARKTGRRFDIDKILEEMRHD